jgi:hypothetical protein
MSRAHFAFYLAVGITFVLLNLWRFTHGKLGATVRPISLVLGIAILAMLAASLIGVISLDAVEECLDRRPGHRSKWLVEVRRAAP